MGGKLTKIKAGKAIGAQADFAETINTLIDFVKNLEGAGDILLDRGSFPTCRIKMQQANDNPGGGIPPGYEEETLNIVCDGKIVTRKVLVETASKADVATWSSSNSREILQVGTGGTLIVGKGYLKS